MITRDDVILVTVVILIILIITVVVHHTLTELYSPTKSDPTTKRLFNDSEPSHHTKSEWYEQFGIWKRKIIEYKITEEEVYDMYQNLVRIQESSKYYFYPEIKRVSLVTLTTDLLEGVNRDEIYNEIVRLSQPLKEYPRLYEQYWGLVSNNTGSQLYLMYCMDHKQLVNHFIEIRGRRISPEENSARTMIIINAAKSYQRMLKDGSNSNPLWTLARWTIGDFFK